MKVTFVLFTYNQESCVANALLAVLAQDYEDLEIIVSDDSSVDETFAIIENIVSEYQGNHEIILNRNVENLGVVAHANKALSLASGEWIVTGAGDDISHPTRVSKMVEVINEHTGEDECSLMAVGSGWRYFSWDKITEDQNFKDLFPEVETNRGVRVYENFSKASSLETFFIQEHFVLGATAAWNRKVIEEFGPIPSESVAEDVYLSYGARSLGCAIYLYDEILVMRGDEGISMTEKPAKLIRGSYEASSGLVEKYKQFFPEKNCVYTKMEKELKVFQKVLNYEHLSLIEKYSQSIKLLVKGGVTWWRPHMRVKLLVRAIRKLYRILKIGVWKTNRGAW